MTQPLYHKDK